MIYGKGSLFTGKYPVADPDKLAAADYIVAHEFGAPPEGFSGAVNMMLALFIANNKDLMKGKPVYAAPTIARAMKSVDEDYKFAGEFAAVSSDMFATEGGTQSELRQAREMAGATGDEISMHIAQAFHAGRVAKQALHAGMEPVLPPGLPREFDSTSVQPWCRNQLSWIPRELVGVPYLLAKKQF